VTGHFSLLTMAALNLLRDENFFFFSPISTPAEPAAHYTVRLSICPAVGTLERMHACDRNEKEQKYRELMGLAES